MKDYLALIRDGKEKIRSPHSINWSVLDLDSIEVENHSKRAGLQIADVISSAVFFGIEPNIYGNCEHKYAEILIDKFIKLKGKRINFGIVPIPPLGKTPLNEEQKKFFEKFR
jgi:hypothetical protein